MPREDADVLPLRGEVHALEEGVEAGVGAEGVEGEGSNANQPSRNAMRLSLSSAA